MFTTIWKVRSTEAGKFRIEYRTVSDISQQQEPTKVEHADTKKAAIHKAVCAGARVWN